ncbi:MAG: type II/IV secretion system ATPase subunit [archaeon GB-1867-005]|nr:type II/IV secretion system ATPase subunit [Candidatus Culexmicrobium cathedralense]
MLKLKFRRKVDYKRDRSSSVEVRVFRSCISDGVEVLDSYKVCNDQVQVVIAERGGEGLYLINEPSLLDVEVEIYHKLSNLLRFELELPECEVDLARFIRAQARRIAADYGFKAIYDLSIDRIIYFVQRDLGYGPIEPLMRDPDIEDIKCVGPGFPFIVWHRRFGHLDWLTTNVILTEAEMNALASKLAHMAGKHVSIAFPIVDAVLPDKHRVSICYGREVSQRSTNICIRKFREKPYTVMHLIYDFNTLSALMAAYFWMLIENKKSIFVIGGTATGKTTLLSALGALFKPDWTVETIEDVPELKIPVKGWEPLVTRHAYAVGEKISEITLFDLVKVAMRKRPDYIVVGEIRGEEAYVLFQAAATGHGCMCTMHAASLEAAIKRLTSPPMSVSPSYIPLMNCAVIVRRVELTSGVYRKVVGVYEIEDYGKYRRIFNWIPSINDFEPKSVEAIVSESRILGQICIERGWSMRRVCEEIKRRVNFFQELNDRGVREYEDFVKELRSFYSKKPNYAFKEVFKIEV